MDEETFSSTTDDNLLLPIHDSTENRNSGIVTLQPVSDRRSEKSAMDKLTSRNSIDSEATTVAGNLNLGNNRSPLTKIGIPARRVPTMSPTHLGKHYRKVFPKINQKQFACCWNGL